MIISTESEYRQALAEVEGLMELGEAIPAEPEGKRLDELVTAIEAYEAVHYPRIR